MIVQVGGKGVGSVWIHIDKVRNWCRYYYNGYMKYNRIDTIQNDTMRLAY